MWPSSSSSVPDSFLLLWVCQHLSLQNPTSSLHESLCICLEMHFFFCLNFFWFVMASSSESSCISLLGVGITGVPSHSSCLLHFLIVLPQSSGVWCPSHLSVDLTGFPSSSHNGVWSVKGGEMQRFQQENQQWYFIKVEFCIDFGTKYKFSMCYDHWTLLPCMIN